MKNIVIKRLKDQLNNDNNTNKVVKSVETSSNA